MKHLAGAGRVNSANYSTCLHRLARMVALPAHPSGRNNNDCNGGRQSGAEEAGNGAVEPAISAAGVPTAEMACGVDPGTSVLEGSNVQENWATDFSCMVGGGSGGKAKEAEDILGAIASGMGGSSSIASTRGGRQWRSPKPPPLPLPALWASLARETMGGCHCPHCRHCCLGC